MTTTLTDEQIRSGIYAEVEEEEETDADGSDGDGDGTAPTGPTAATTTAPTAATRTGPTATPTAPTRASNALARWSSRSAQRSSRGLWEQQPLAVPRGRKAGRRPPFRRGRRAAGLLRRPAHARAPAREGGRDDLGGQYATDISWRPKPFLGTSTPTGWRTPSRSGATIVLQALHHTWLPLARFCRELEAELGAGVQANSYYTPRRSQGFAVHHDTHDVFVLQVAGEKHWRVYDPLLELPLKNQRWS